MRGFDEAALTDKSWGPRLKSLSTKLSDGDKSVLLALLKEDAEKSASAMTTRGSSNDWFWALLSNVGWMQECSEVVPEPLQASVVAYSVTSDGRHLLPGLLPTFF